jgi:phospholipid/cholesterol/gamma-HCH transport system permease protein
MGLQFLRALPAVLRKSPLIIDQMLYMGVKSLPLITLVSVFTGSVTSWQAAYQFESSFIPMRYLGLTVGKSIVIELAPVLTAIVVAGRVGASIAAELGTMRVTEQIDALEVMAIDPIKHLVMPRVIAGVIMLPVLVIFANLIAISGALFVAVNLVDMASETFLNGFKSYFLISDMVAGLIKAAVFGYIISFIGCFEGFRTRGGAMGVGQSTTRAVVVSAVLILVADFVVAIALFRV